MAVRQSRRVRLRKPTNLDIQATISQLEDDDARTEKLLVGERWTLGAPTRYLGPSL
jgi:hypothetical protein